MVSTEYRIENSKSEKQEKSSRQELIAAHYCLNYFNKYIPHHPKNKFRSLNTPEYLLHVFVITVQLKTVQHCLYQLYQMINVIVS